MNGRVARLAALFVDLPADAPRAATPRRRTRRAPATLTADVIVVVLGGREAVVVATLAARRLARAARQPCAVCCVWGSPVPASLCRPPAAPAARALAGRLATRGHDAFAAGRVVLVRLDGDEPEARAAAARVVAAAERPTVVALAAPLAEPLAPEPGRCDLVLLAMPPSADAALGALASSRLRDANPGLPVAAVDLAAHGARRGRRVADAIVEGLG